MSTPVPIPVQKFKAWSLPRGCWEIWEAVSDDGRWHFVRDETPGTPWIVTHADFPGWHAVYPTLAKARKLAERQLHLDLTTNLQSEMSRS